MLNTAHQIAESVSNKEISALETLEEHLSLIDALEPQVKAWVCVDRDGARRFASSIDETEDPSGPLLGVPIGVKDIFDASGLVTTCGAGPFAHFTPETDATTVHRLREAGAVL